MCIALYKDICADMFMYGNGHHMAAHTRLSAHVLYTDLYNCLCRLA